MSRIATAALLLSLVGGAFAQDSSAAASSAAGSTDAAVSATAVASGSAPASGATNVAGASTSVDASILSMTAASTGPQGFQIPALSELTSGAPTDSTVALDTTYTAGATATVSGAPVLPTSALTIANYPALDKTPPTDSDEVKGWLAKMDMSKIPTYNVTTGDCSTDPSAITDGRCWWTCGGCTRDTDITECPDKMTWGLSYDDGPSPFTPLLLDYLNEVDIKTTFFLVGSRVLSRPEIVQSEYMAGHHLSVHTWSHAALTTLTNEQIVAELGWTQKVIKDVTGVSPNTFRPPYGDIDDRVRAVAAQMGMTPIIWTSYTDNGLDTNFDTNDWHISGGTATGASSLETFDTILNEYVPKLDTGFIVLAHDIYQQTVDLAVGYVLPQAIASGKYQLKSIIECLNKPLSEAYVETSANATTTQITQAASGTYFQATVGTATGSIEAVTSGASGSGASGSSGASASASASGSSGNSAASSRVDFTKVVPALVALGAVAAGMAVVA
ncbi:chitin deacetylase [Kwoniella heveanensis CBS 569]|uniref:chitin deacetylase n=1 Tax=Kwoniella heveanensis BCC8398 TaxID=1296120 RepID=A0A1B9GX56_9TREE|nr:chitin deacetylase [Kwoniella heveanensis BCC8398]OCF40973.1 chitin deacetylase [Kwoniella heveanensis CBS 569]